MPERSAERSEAVMPDFALLTKLTKGYHNFIMSEKINLPELLSVTEVSKLLGVSVVILRRWDTRGILNFFGQHRVVSGDIKEL
ncbi:MAG: hypothetical protein GX627_00330 [Parcubacteria group bacterium]|jgi:hypothetical protein|nr:hypothetical protein [Parcubacteria group bacterium]